MDLRIIFFMMLCCCGGCHEPVSEKKEMPASGRKAIAAVQLEDLDGRRVSLEQYSGRTVFLNFWATWCKPCVKEMPHIKSAQDLLARENIVFLLASDETSDQIKEFREDHYPELNFVRLLNMEELGLQGLPTTYVFNPRGELAFSETGYRKWSDSSNIQMLRQINTQR